MLQALERPGFLFERQELDPEFGQRRPENLPADTPEIGDRIEVKKEIELAMAAKQTAATLKTMCVLCEEYHKAGGCPSQKAVLKLASEGSRQ